MFHWFSRREKEVATSQPLTSHWPPENTGDAGEGNWLATSQPVATSNRGRKKREGPVASQWPSASCETQETIEIAVRNFVLWLQREGYHGPIWWQDLWNIYRSVYSQVATDRPVAPNYKTHFAQHLGRICKRSSYRKTENGRRRWYRIYHIQPLNEKMEMELIQNAA